MGGKQDLRGSGILGEAASSVPGVPSVKRVVRSSARAYTALREHLASRRQSAQAAADIRALVALSTIPTGYLPWSGSALQPTTAQRLLNNIVVNERRRIVELGAGVSTLLIAGLNRSLGLHLHLTSVDQSAEWLEFIGSRAREIDPTLAIQCIHAPLRPYGSGPFRINRWYERDAIAEIAGPIDLLIVDGPTAGERHTAHDRWPALPELLEQLSDSCAVLMDDTHRRGERRIVRDWRTSNPDFAIRRMVQATFLSRGTSWTT
ncbi:MAG: class I SAM-dependent methyltransferase [Acidimicrobiales bacterium]|nr:class I SAM-dependent methyltransferase [Acidimicrobiales bacterium]